MQHLAIIPDGNRRWAAQNKLKSFFGHQRGMEIVESAIKICIKNDIRYLSFYTFSIENFDRSADEKNYLFNLLADSFVQQLPTLIEQGVKVRFIGQDSAIPNRLKKVIAQVENATCKLTTLTLVLLFCYGATAEITDTARRLALQVKAGTLLAEDITEDSFKNALWTGDIPSPDLIIRTGGAVRMSNFLLYQAAYSELKFVDTYWPDVTEAQLEDCVGSFKGVQRNFGR
jgi:undecaprenyl diphosphate synthase